MDKKQFEAKKAIIDKHKGLIDELMANIEKEYGESQLAEAENPELSKPLQEFKILDLGFSFDIDASPGIFQVETPDFIWWFNQEEFETLIIKARRLLHTAEQNKERRDGKDNA